jgi:hypothetical protein
VGRGMSAPRPGEGGPRHPWARCGQSIHTYNIKSYIFCKSQTFPNSSLPQIVKSYLKSIKTFPKVYKKVWPFFLSIALNVLKDFRKIEENDLQANF